MFDDPLHLVLLFAYGVFVFRCASELEGRGRWHWIARVIFVTGMVLITPIIGWLMVMSSGSLPDEWLMWMLEWDAIPFGLFRAGVIAVSAGALLFIAADTVLCWRGRRKLLPFMYASRD